MYRPVFGTNLVKIGSLSYNTDHLAKSCPGHVDKWSYVCAGESLLVQPLSITQASAS